MWVGKKVHEKEKAEALRNARGFVKKKRYPNNVKVTRVVEGSEPLEFKALFLAWHDDNGNKANSGMLINPTHATDMPRVFPKIT